MPSAQTRRRVLTGIACVGAAVALPARRARAAEAPPEITTIRIAKSSAICIAPQYVAEELLRAEGFRNVRYIASPVGDDEQVARGNIDLAINYAANIVMDLDRGMSVDVLAGVMVGCYELFGGEHIHSIAELRGKSVGVGAQGSLSRNLVVLMAAEVGLDPEQDIRWVIDPRTKPKDQFITGRIDAFLGFPPEPQELRARQIGNVLVNTAVDRPWSQYFCCMLAANPGFAQRYPVATKRALRAILKATDLCANEPARAARRLVDGGFTPRFDYALQTFQDNRYDRWREFDPEDTLRFYALHMRDARMITSTPQQIIAKSANWRFLDELRRELKA